MKRMQIMYTKYIPFLHCKKQNQTDSSLAIILSVALLMTTGFELLGSASAPGTALSRRFAQLLHPLCSVFSTAAAATVGAAAVTA